MSVHSGTPPEIINRIHADAVSSLKEADLLPRLTAAGLEINPTTTEEFSTLIRADMAKWGKVIVPGISRLALRKSP